MILLLFGPDELARRRRLQELREEADGGTGMLESNYTLLDGKSAKPPDILGVAMATPFLAPARLVVVEGFLDRLQTRGRAQPRIPEAWLPFFDTLDEGLPDTTMLVLGGGALDPKRNAAVERMRGGQGVSLEECAGVPEKAFAGWVRQEAARQGVTFRNGRSTRPLDPDDEWTRPKEGDPAQLLAAVNSRDGMGNTLAVANEIEKLKLFALGRDVTVDDVDLLCGGDRESRIWDFTDACADGDLMKAMASFTYLTDKSGEGTGGLLAMLAATYRRLGIAAEMLEANASPEEIGQAIKRPWPNLRDKDIARARRLGVSGVVAAYEAIVEADRANKQGRVAEDLAIEVLITRLAGLAPAHAD